MACLGKRNVFRFHNSESRDDAKKQEEDLFLGFVRPKWRCGDLLQCCFTSTETVRTIKDGSPGRSPRLSHTAPELSCDCRDGQQHWERLQTWASGLHSLTTWSEHGKGTQKRKMPDLFTFQFRSQCYIPNCGLALFWVTLLLVSTVIRGKSRFVSIRKTEAGDFGFESVPGDELLLQISVRLDVSDTPRCVWYMWRETQMLC